MKTGIFNGLKVRTILIVIFLTTFHILSAQQVKNVTFEQRDKKIAISYDIENENNLDTYDVKIYYSIDDGLFWIGPLQYISGDTGSEIKPGKAKIIIWDVLSETTNLIGNLQFKITAKVHYVMDKSYWKTFYQYMIGIKSGLNIAKQVGYMDDYSKSLVGFNIGVFHRFNGDGLVSIQQEILFDRKGSKYNLSEISYNNNNYTTYFDYLSINPIIVQINIRKTSPRIYPELGLSIGVLFNRNKIADSYDIVESEVEPLESGDYEQVNVQAFAGIGIIVYNRKNCISFSLRYCYGISGIYDNNGLSYYDSYQSDNIQKYNRGFSINMGILF